VANVTRVPLGYNSAYLIEAAGRRLLVDTGPDFRGAAGAIESLLHGNLPDLALATHGHLDHAGLGRHWQERGVPVALGADDLHLVNRPGLSDPLEFRGFQEFIESSGAPPGPQGELLAGIEQRREWALRAAANGPYPPPPSDRRWPSGLRYRSFVPDVLIATDGRALDGFPALVLRAPGHTPGNLVVAVPEEGWLFSGDQLLPAITPTPAIQRQPRIADGVDWRFHSLPAFVASLRRLEKLRFQRCFPGHGEPFDNVDEVIRTNLAQAEQRAARVLAVLKESGPATVFGLCEAIYPRAVQRRAWQIVATVQGHLDLLEAEGRASCVGGLYSAAL